MKWITFNPTLMARRLREKEAENSFQAP